MIVVGDRKIFLLVLLDGQGGFIYTLAVPARKMGGNYYLEGRRSP